MFLLSIGLCIIFVTYRRSHRVYINEKKVIPTISSLNRCTEVHIRSQKIHQIPTPYMEDQRALLFAPRILFRALPAFSYNVQPPELHVHFSINGSLGSLLFGLSCSHHQYGNGSTDAYGGQSSRVEAPLGGRGHWTFHWCTFPLQEVKD